MTEAVLVRPARESDRARLGELAGALVRFHHAIDAHRFMRVDRVEEGYGKWLASEAKNQDALVLVAEVDGRVVGYTYARKEPRNWNDLIDAHGKLHDIFVDPEARKRGVARELLRVTCEKLRELGCPRIVLSTAAGNAPAQKLFASFGFRSTMIEMTIEADEITSSQA